MVAKECTYFSKFDVSLQLPKTIKCLHTQAPVRIFNKFVFEINSKLFFFLTFSSEKYSENLGATSVKIKAVEAFAATTK